MWYHRSASFISRFNLNDNIYKPTTKHGILSCKQMLISMPEQLYGSETYYSYNLKEFPCVCKNIELMF